MNTEVLKDMPRRTRSHVFEIIVNKIKERKFIGRSELSAETITNPDLFRKIISAMEKVGMIKRSYVLSHSGRQREMLEAVNLDNSELYIKALAKVLIPSLRELFDKWYGKRHAAVDTRTKEELENEKKGHSTINLLSELHSRGRASEYE